MTPAVLRLVVVFVFTGHALGEVGGTNKLKIKGSFKLYTIQYCNNVMNDGTMIDPFVVCVGSFRL